jgi:hypothetical protein
MVIVIVSEVDINLFCNLIRLDSLAGFYCTVLGKVD